MRVLFFLGKVNKIYEVIRIGYNLEECIGVKLVKGNVFLVFESWVLYGIL